MNEDRRSPKERARSRRSWPGRVTALSEVGEDDQDDLFRATAAERVAMVWRVTVDAWLLSGRQIIQTPRHELPGVLVRGADRR